VLRDTSYQQGISPQPIGSQVFSRDPNFLGLSVINYFSTYCCTCNHAYFNTNTWSYTDDLTIVRGRHQIMVGADVSRTQMNAGAFDSGPALLLECLPEMQFPMTVLLVLLLWQSSAAQDALAAKARGVRAAQTGDYAQASREFGQACRLDPKLTDVCFYEGRALYYSNRFEEALPPLQKSVEIGESQSRALSTEAECLEALGRSAEAERAHRKAIEGDHDPQYLVRYAVFLFRQGRSSEAVAPLTRALQSKPEDFDANLEMGRVLFEQDKLAEALPFLATALKARPASTQAHLLAAKVCQRLGRSSEAERHLKAAQVPEP